MYHHFDELNMIRFLLGHICIYIKLVSEIL